MGGAITGALGGTATGGTITGAAITGGAITGALGGTATGGTITGAAGAMTGVAMAGRWPEMDGGWLGGRGGTAPRPAGVTMGSTADGRAGPGARGGAATAGAEMTGAEITGRPGAGPGLGVPPGAGPGRGVAPSEGAGPGRGVRPAGAGAGLGVNAWLGVTCGTNGFALGAVTRGNGRAGETGGTPGAAGGLPELSCPFDMLVSTTHRAVAGRSLWLANCVA